jgi:hypothetical protein
MLKVQNESPPHTRADAEAVMRDAETEQKND